VECERNGWDGNGRVPCQKGDLEHASKTAVM